MATNDLFSSLVADIKSYTGNDPILPWLRGIRKLRDSLSTHVLNEKLPRFLQKCAQTFESDRRYRNDLRFVRIWLQLMDYVDDPKALLQTMEVKRIGVKRSLFYQAYALYYEKFKKFEEADKMYRLGVQNLAEPMDELQKSYEKFIQRIERHKNKRVQSQEGRTAKRPLSDQSTMNHRGSSDENHENILKVDQTLKGSLLKESNKVSVLTEPCPNLIPKNEAKSGEGNKLSRDDSVVVKFVDSAMVGRSEAEDACHHGLVEPTINMKEAMDAINSMFQEPIEPVNVVRKSLKGQPKSDQSISNGFEVFIDENSDNTVKSSCQYNREKLLAPQAITQHHHQELLQIFVDDELSNDSEPSEIQASKDGSPSSSSRVDAFVFLRPNDHQSESSNDMKTGKSSKTQFREDTVVCRFVGTAILDEPEVENICHHGLVDPTVNLKEAMEDINGMFGKPIEFVRTTRRKRYERAVTTSRNNDYGGFSILPDDELETPVVQQPPQSSSNKENRDFFEPTVFTKEAMDDIDNLFRMPLDF